ncbi:MAG TPA: DUF898 family protein [Dongiaceae bacterium]|nr:DUF898 family protein [Dongiaceae bacterium]
MGTTHVQKLRYDGRIGALYWIFIKIVLLNIVTLTIYRFWGKAQLRRYVWSHMQLQGERLEYTGTGLELFLGFLLVIGLFSLFYAGIFLGALLFGQESALGTVLHLILPFFLIYLPMVAIYAAQRYRLTRTLWRGIRGGMTGSAWTYGFRALGYSLLVAVTAGLATPWAQMRLAEQRFNNSYFGDAKASLQASSKPVYKAFFLGFITYVVLMALLLAALYNIFDVGTLFARLSHPGGGQADPEQMARMAWLFFAAYLCVILGAAIIGVFAFSWYAASFFKAIAAGLRFDNLTFRSAMGALDYFRFWLGNILILAVTLGIGLPIIVHRSLRFFADRLEIIGEIDIERLKQNTLPKPRTGEGLLETFDAGFW